MNIHVRDEKELVYCTVKATNGDTYEMANTCCTPQARSRFIEHVRRTVAATAARDGAQLV